MVNRRYIEWALYNYKPNKVQLRLLKKNLKEELDAVKDISAINYNQEKVSETNETGDPTAEYLEKKEQIKERYNKKMKELEEHIEIVELSLSLMTEREKKIIERRYIDGRQWTDIAIDEDIDITPRSCRRIRTEALSRLIDMLNGKEEENENVL